MVLRSDEAASQAEIERDAAFRSNIKKGIATAASIAAPYVIPHVAPALASRIAPFLNKYIPPSLAIQGINKINPKLGSFLKKGADMGLDVEDGLNFLKDKLFGDKQESSKAENRNIIEQYLPELHQYLDQKIKSGEDVISAATQAVYEKGKPFEKIIRKIEKDHKTPWTALVESIYGGQKKPLTENEKSRRNALQKFNERKKGVLNQERERFEQGYGQQLREQSDAGNDKWNQIASTLQNMLNS